MEIFEKVIFFIRDESNNFITKRKTPNIKI